DRSPSWRFLKHPQSISHVIEDEFCPRPSPHPTHGLFDQPDVAEFPPRRRFGILRALASLHAIADRHLQVALDLFFQLFFASPSPEWELHASLSFLAGFKMPSTASVSRSQRERSAAKCFFPAAVRR